MATSPVGSSSSSSSGGGVGPIDVGTIVSQLMQVESQPLVALQQQEAGVTAQITALGQVQSAVSTFQTAADALGNKSTWNALAPTVSGTGITAAVSDPTQAASGQYSINVTSLAASAALASGQFASSSTVVGDGTLTLQVGTGAATSITIDSSNDTLAGIRDAINAANAGVSAAIVNDGSKVRLTLVANSSGAANTVTVGIAPTAPATSTTLSQLEYDGTAHNLTLTRPAADAQFSVNGLTLASPTNQVTGVIAGVTVNLSQANSTNQVTLAPDTASMQKALSDFASAYNGLISTIKSLTAYDPSSQTAAVLNGDSAMRSLQQQVQSLVGSSVPGGSGDITYLSQVGLQVQKDGTLTLDSATFNAAAANPAKLQRFFTNASTVPGSQGLGLRLQSFADQAVSSSGIVQSDTQSLQSQVTALKQRENDENTRLNSIQQQLTAQYSALNAQLAQMQQISASLASELNQLTVNELASASPVKTN
jgi:flagellar hook-associated protein 2